MKLFSPQKSFILNKIVKTMERKLRIMMDCFLALYSDVKIADNSKEYFDGDELDTMINKVLYNKLSKNDLKRIEKLIPIYLKNY